jgi:hypothetical protein
MGSLKEANSKGHVGEKRRILKPTKISYQSI